NRVGVSWLGITKQRQVVRLMSVGDEPVRINTTHPAPDDVIELPGRGAYMDVQSFADFYAEADGPITLMSVLVSQAAAHVPSGFPGGHPTIVIVPQIEQYRSDYVFLTPDKYIFDFVLMGAPPQAQVRLDGMDAVDLGCGRVPADGLSDTARGSSVPPAWVYQCQISFPVVLQDGSSRVVLPGSQSDGVHRIEASLPVHAIVYGFDNYVSYGCAAGTQLSETNIK
ncbi:MAG: IgGFc-binding protein, partial [Polyangiaceae bacterium]|nr:IgGFc-binding protein [Polyangiaceae bacterium]